MYLLDTDILVGFLRKNQDAKAKHAKYFRQGSYDKAAFYVKLRQVTSS